MFVSALRFLNYYTTQRDTKQEIHAYIYMKLSSDAEHFHVSNVQLIWARTTTTPSNAKSIYYDIIRAESNTQTQTHTCDLWCTSANMRVQTDINHQSWQPLIKQWQHDVSLVRKVEDDALAKARRRRYEVTIGLIGSSHR